MIELNSENFDDKTSKGKWIIDFWAEWCTLCKSMAPHFEAAAKEFIGKVNFAKVDAESNPDIAEKFDIMRLPTLVLLNDGEQVNRAPGDLRKEEIKKLVEESF